MVTNYKQSKVENIIITQNTHTQETKYPNSAKSSKAKNSKDFKMIQDQCQRRPTPQVLKIAKKT